VLSQPKIGDTVYIIAKVIDICLPIQHRNVIRVQTNKNDLKDQFLIYTDQLALIEEGADEATA